MVLIKYERVTSISRKKKTKIKICRSVQVLTIIQLTTSIFFPHLHIYMIRCKNRIESLTKKAGKKLLNLLSKNSTEEIQNV